MKNNLFLNVLIFFLLLINTNVTSQNKIVNPVTKSSQPFSVTAIINSHNYTITNGIYKIHACPYDTISISATGNYTSNDISYHQSDTTTNFVWLHQLNSTINNNSFISYNNNAMATRVILFAKDIQNNLSSDSIIIEIIISPKPIFSGINHFIDSICLGDSLDIMGGAFANSFPLLNTLTDTNTVYLPDGNGVSYLSTINVSGSQDLTISNAEMISVSAILEHSYSGDINIELICPNGQSAILKSFPGGGANFLGEPIDNNSAQVPGLGYEYIWNMGSDSTMAQYFNQFQYSYTDNLGGISTNHSYLPPSTSYPVNSTAYSATDIRTYLPEQSFAAFNGCPMTGDWTLKITDNLAIDNGFIFGWGIDFRNISTSNITYNQQIISQGWNTDPSITNYFANNININPLTIGFNNYSYYATDSVGCTFDTTITIKTIEIPELNIGNDTILCADQSLLLDAGDNYYQQWSTQSTNHQELIDSNGVGLNTTTVYLNVHQEYGCANSDTINITFAECNSINTNKEEIISIDIFPNPSQGMFIIEAELLSKENVLIQIFDIYGKEILNNKLQNTNGNIHQCINLSNLSKGTYILRLQNRNGSFYNSKVIIK